MGEMVYLFGDSIAKGVIFNEARGRYALTKERFENLLNKDEITIVNRAFMGATLPKGLEEFRETDIPAGAIVAIEYGGNDCDLDWKAVSERPGEEHAANTPLAAFAEGLRAFIALARARGLRPLVVSTVPLLSGRYFAWLSKGLDKDAILAYLGDAEHIGRWQERYARAVASVARDMSCPMFDLREAFLARRDFPRLMCLDGIHPNESGHRVIYEAILADKERIKALL